MGMRGLKSQPHMLHIRYRQDTRLRSHIALLRDNRQWLVQPCPASVGKDNNSHDNHHQRHLQAGAPTLAAQECDAAQKGTGVSSGRLFTYTPMAEVCDRRQLNKMCTRRNNRTGIGATQASDLWPALQQCTQQNSRCRLAHEGNYATAAIEFFAQLWPSSVETVAAMARSIDITVCAT